MTLASKIYILINSSIYILQSAIMIFCYGSLINGLYFTATVCTENDEEENSEKKKLVLTFLLASLAFLIGYWPHIVGLCILVASEDKEQNYDPELFSVLKTVSRFLLELTLCLNPILYAFRSSSYQQEFKRLLICKKPTPNNDIVMREERGIPLNYFSLRSSYPCDFILSSGSYNKFFTAIICNKFCS